MASVASGATLSSFGKSAAAARTKKDKTITEVVHFLQNMLEESKKEGDTERVLYAKYKCYCDDQEAKKTSELEAANENILLLESEIEDLLAKTAQCSIDMAQNEKEIREVNKSLADALQVRNSEKSAFDAFESDTNVAIGACNSSIIELAGVGADQTLEKGADHKQFMSDFSLRQLKATVKQALISSSATISKQQNEKLTAFIQGPFTGTYTSQSGEIFGIIKDMRDTFRLNLADATAAENKAKNAYLEFKGVNEARWTIMTGTTRPGLQGDMGTYNGDLGDRRSQLTVQKGIKTNTEKFLNALTTQCDTKAKEYQHRVLLRTNEQMAVSKGIAILNSDAAFALFDKVNATSTGATGFLQVRSVKRHEKKHYADPDEVQRERAKSYLRGAAGKTHSVLLSKIVAMLEVGNPFGTVLAKIQDIIDVIDEEGTADDEQLSWCNDERTTNDAEKKKKGREIRKLKGKIKGLKKDINHPVTGLLKSISDTEEKIRVNDESQKDETADRKESQAIYARNIRTCVEAEDLLNKAIAVLEEYYKGLADRQFSLLQNHKRGPNVADLPKTATGTAAAGYVAPAAPSTWGTADAGQGADGNDAVTMLKFILTETHDEEESYHEAELKEQENYEDSMKTLTDTEKTEKGNLATFQGQLAKKQKKLNAAEKDLEETQAEKQAILAYLKEIKPGCDFITKNIDLRKSNRDEEKTALETARSLIKNSPAYKTAVAEAHNETLGECLEFCAGDDEDTANCKACLAGVTVPAYCAGHPTTTGC